MTNKHGSDTGNSLIGYTKREVIHPNLLRCLLLFLKKELRNQAVLRHKCPWNVPLMELHEHGWFSNPTGITHNFLAKELKVKEDLEFPQTAPPIWTDSIGLIRKTEFMEWTCKNRRKRSTRKPKRAKDFNQLRAFSRSLRKNHCSQQANFTLSYLSKWHS